MTPHPLKRIGPVQKGLFDDTTDKGNGFDCANS